MAGHFKSLSVYQWKGEAKAREVIVTKPLKSDRRIRDCCLLPDLSHFSPGYNIAFLLLECVIYPNAYLSPSWCINSYLLLYLSLLNFASINRKCRFGDIQCFRKNVRIFFLFLSGLLPGSKSEETPGSLKKCKKPHSLLRHQIILIVVLVAAALLLW